MTKSEEKIYLEISGPDLEPENAPTTLALEAASAFFNGIEKIAKAEKRTLDLWGLSVENKCVQISAMASDGNLASDYSHVFHEVLGGERPAPRGAADDVKRFRSVLSSLPHQYTMRSRIGEREHVRFVAPGTEALSLWKELASLRVRIESVGGATPKARFSSHYEPHGFGLEASQELAKGLAMHLYEEVDIEAEVIRDSDGRIKEGRIEKFFPLEDNADMESLRNWYYSVGGDKWDVIDDLIDELKRD